MQQDPAGNKQKLLATNKLASRLNSAHYNLLEGYPFFATGVLAYRPTPIRRSPPTSSPTSLLSRTAPPRSAAARQLFPRLASFLTPCRVCRCMHVGVPQPLLNMYCTVHFLLSAAFVVIYAIQVG